MQLVAQKPMSTCNHISVTHWMDEVPWYPVKMMRFHPSPPHAVRHKLHLPSQPLNGIYLSLRAAVRCHNGAWYAHLLSIVGQALCKIASTACVHAIL